MREPRNIVRARRSEAVPVAQNVVVTSAADPMDIPPWPSSASRLRAGRGASQKNRRRPSQHGGGPDGVVRMQV